MDKINLLDPGTAEMLKAVGIVFEQFGIDYYLVGAVARDIHLSGHPKFEAKRKTEDIDIAVMIDDKDQYDVVREALIATGDFTQHSETVIKFIYKESIELDLLPFGAIEDESEKIYLNREGLLAMDMSGFKKVYPFVEQIEVSENLRLQVCPLEGIIVLKLIAYDDNSARDKDLTDIEHLVEVFAELDDDAYYQSGLLEDYENNDDFQRIISARVLGRRMRHILDEPTREQIREILDKQTGIIYEAMRDGLNDVINE